MQNSSLEWLKSAMGSNMVVWPPWQSYLLGSDHMDSLSVLATEYQPWICSIIGAIAIGLAGIVPLLLIPSDNQIKSSSGEYLFFLHSFQFGDGMIFNIRFILVMDDKCYGHFLCHN